MIRDSRKPYEYFSEYIDVQNGRIEKFQNCLPDVVRNEQKTKQLHLYLSNLKLDLIYAQYSCGVEVEIIKETFLSYLENVKMMDKLSYMDTLNVLALAVLFDISDVSFLNEADSFTDCFTAYLNEQPYKTPDFQSFPEIIKPMVKSVSENHADLLLDYVETKWYDNCKELAWYDSHTSGQDTYTGYWSFIAAAIIKICKFDKDSFEKSVYIPVDLI